MKQSTIPHPVEGQVTVCLFVRSPYISHADPHILRMQGGHGGVFSCSSWFLTYLLITKQSLSSDKSHFLTQGFQLAFIVLHSEI